MAKNWYPEIDYTLCKECGTCTAKCKNGVYDLTQKPKPVVINTDGCMDHCMGCGKLCPNGAISYFGNEANK